MCKMSILFIKKKNKWKSIEKFDMYNIQVERFLVARGEV